MVYIPRGQNYDQFEENALDLKDVLETSIYFRGFHAFLSTWANQLIKNHADISLDLSLEDTENVVPKLEVPRKKAQQNTALTLDVKAIVIMASEACLTGNIVTHLMG